MPKDDPNYESRLEAHASTYPKVRPAYRSYPSRPTDTQQQVTPLIDTATTVRGIYRTPTRESFNPVGHISLDMEFPAAEPLGLTPPGGIWIKSLYVSNALQSSGLGRAAMDALEAMAGKEPLSARALMLDAVCKEDQMREDFATSFYGYLPKVCFTELQGFYRFWLTEELRSRMRIGMLDEATRS